MGKLSGSEHSDGPPPPKKQINKAEKKAEFHGKVLKPEEIPEFLREEYEYEDEAPKT